MNTHLLPVFKDMLINAITSLDIEKFISTVGYLPRDAARRIAPLMDNGRCFLAEFVRVTRCPPHEKVGMMVRIVETTDLPMT
jgi:hypothetical protein